MRTDNLFLKSTFLTALLFASFSVGGIAQDTNSIVNPEKKAPTILATNPADGEMNVNQNSVIKITFSNDMDEKSINGTTLLLHATHADTMYKKYGEMQQEHITDNTIIKDSENTWQYTTDTIGGTISYSNKIAVFTPSSELKEGTLYTFTVTNGVKNLENIALKGDHNWSFTTIGTSDSPSFNKINDRFGMNWTGTTQ